MSEAIDGEQAVDRGAPDERAVESGAPSEQTVDGGAPAQACEGLLLDWGGVMTSNLLAAFASFCEAEGLDPQAIGNAFRENKAARDVLIGFEEGRVAEVDFEAALAELLGVSVAEGLVDRLFLGAQPESAMVEAVRAARAAGVRTGLISNSWGTTRYPRDLLHELFDGVVISGEVGIRKPTPRIYQLGAEAIGLPPRRCVFVDDLPFNLPPAQELGMAVVHHTTPETTIAALQRLLGISLVVV